MTATTVTPTVAEATARAEAAEAEATRLRTQLAHARSLLDDWETGRRTLQTNPPRPCRTRSPR